MRVGAKEQAAIGRRTILGSGTSGRIREQAADPKKVVPNAGTQGGVLETGERSDEKSLRDTGTSDRFGNRQRSRKKYLLTEC